MSHGAHQTDNAYAVSLVEDFCLSPKDPIGYMICQKLSISERQCGTVRGCGSPILTMASRISSVVGNEAGVGGGVVSGVHLGICRPVELSATSVRAEGEFLLRDGTLVEMNCASTESAGNTIGKITYASSEPPPVCENALPEGPAKCHVDVNLNDITNTLGAIINLPLALLLKGVSYLFPQIEPLLMQLPKTYFGTGDKSGAGAIFGNNDGNGAPGVLGIAMGLAHAQGIWGDEAEFEVGQGPCGHDGKVNPHGGSNSVLSALETVGQGLGILARKLGIGPEFFKVIVAIFGAPDGYGFVQGVQNGANIVV